MKSFDIVTAARSARARQQKERDREEAQKPQQRSPEPPEQPAMSRLAREVAAFEITGNPVFAWRAIAECLRLKVDMPDAITKFLARVAGSVNALSLKDKVTEHDKIDAVIEMLWLRPIKHPFSGGEHSFDTVWRGFQLRTFVEVARPNSLARQLGIYKGRRKGRTMPLDPGKITRAEVIASAKKAGISESKASDGIGLANKIAKRAAEFRKNWGRKLQK